jgi:hypothetical protein
MIPCHTISYNTTPHHTTTPRRRGGGEIEEAEEENENEKKEKTIISNRVAARAGAIISNRVAARAGASGARVARGVARGGVNNVEKEKRVERMRADLAKYQAKWPPNRKLQVYIRGEAFTMFYSEQGGQRRDWSSTRKQEGAGSSHAADVPWRGTAYTIEQVSTRVE